MCRNAAAGREGEWIEQQVFYKNQNEFPPDIPLFRTTVHQLIFPYSKNSRTTITHRVAAALAT